MSFGAQILKAFLERFAAELIEERFRQFPERDARDAHIGIIAGQLAEQRQVVPNGLQLLQRTAVFFCGGDMRDDALKIAIKIDAFEFDGHCSDGRGAKLRLICPLKLAAPSY